jgi:hypothetical protein
MKNNYFKILPLILLAAAIALSPSFSVGYLSDGKTIEIRFEDILILILGLFWLVKLFIIRKERVKKPPLLLPILAWLSIGFISILSNWIFGSLGFERGFFYFLKELEFFLFYFYVFYHLKNVNAAKLIVNIWFILAGFNVFYVFYQLMMTAPPEKYGEYGTAAIAERGVFPAGSFFLLLFIFLFNVFLYYFLNLNISYFKKGILYFLSVSPIIGAFGSASKTIFLAVVLVLFLTSFFWFVRGKNKKIKKICLIVFTLFFAVSSFLLVLKKVPDSQRILDIFFPTVFCQNVQTGRLDIINNNFEEAINTKSPLLPFTGLGVGYVGEAHNQYLRNFIETGIIGSIVFLILIFVIIKTSWQGFLENKDNFSIGLSAGLLIATLAMLFCSFATEPFIVVKPSEVYWFFTALTMAVLILTEKKERSTSLAF